jgi:hypothetical protein
LIQATEKHDELLRQRLEGLTRTDRDYWSFKGDSRREPGHGFLQYPAMMVPQVARAVLRQAITVHPEIEWVGDPFAGSGTILTESMLQGLSFFGRDVNPLAVLLCRVKSGPFFISALEEKVRQVLATARADRRLALEVDFPNRNKWFRRDVQVALSRLRRAILSEESVWARRFFWVALAEAVRFSSNSRTSTFKLHIRPEEEIDERACDPMGVFARALDRNIQHLKSETKYLKNAGYLQKGHYRKDIDVTLGDSRQGNGSPKCDIIMTSPPYGDGVTTVPYGQYAYLPLQWIELSDIGSDVDDDCLCSTHELDARSLGGSRRVDKNDRQSLGARSPAFNRYLGRLKDLPPDRASRVLAFFRDLDACLSPLLGTLRPGGLMVWTLGNRKVGGKRVPLDTILAELLATHDTKLLCKLKRRITSKRMAPKNNIAETMSTESILVMRKADR